MANKMDVFCVFKIVVIAILSNASEGKTIRYIFEVSYISGYPDGVMTNSILGINGRFPGPTIEGEIGDVLEVILVNLIQDGQNVTLHWHGIYQKDTPFEDGISQITQCPLKQGSYQVYTFPLVQAGTYWYHSHVNSQYTEGLWGSLIVRNTSEVYENQYDGEMLVTLNDWYHTSAHENEKWFFSNESGGASPYPFSVLMNGVGRYPCDYAWRQERFCFSHAQTRPVYRVQPGKSYRLRLINASAWVAFNFTIEGHPFRVIEVDGVDTKMTDPKQAVLISTGQRFSLLIKIPERGAIGSQFLMRAEMRHDFLFTIEGRPNINKYPEAVIKELTGLIEYSAYPSPVGGEFSKIMIPSMRNFDHTQTNVYKSTPWRNLSFFQELDILPYDEIRAPSFFDVNVKLKITYENDTIGNRRGSFNGKPFQFTHQMPLLAMMMNNIEIPEQALPVYVKYGDIVQIVINNPAEGPHPIHMHGHHFWIVGQGQVGDNDYEQLKHRLTFQGSRRDTVLVNEYSWLVIRFKADNVGVWTLHCHIDWHNLAGMAMTFVEAPERKHLLKIPLQAIRICAEHGVAL